MMRRLLLLIIRAYQRLLSPVLGQHCRFAPSCSEYAYQSIAKYSVLTGGKLALKRIVKCHPWHAGGFDPVPDNNKG